MCNPGRHWCNLLEYLFGLSCYSLLSNCGCFFVLFVVFICFGCLIVLYASFVITRLRCLFVLFIDFVILLFNCFLVFCFLVSLLMLRNLYFFVRLCGRCFDCVWVYACRLLLGSSDFTGNVVWLILLVWYWFCYLFWLFWYVF